MLSNSPKLKVTFLVWFHKIFEPIFQRQLFSLKIYVLHSQENKLWAFFPGILF